MDVIRKAICFCETRVRAMNTETLRWSHDWQAWYFPDDKTRTSATWRHAPAKGTPYLYRECPYCGRTLPGCLENDKSQADGNSEGPES